MKTKLIEFRSKDKNILRGILVFPDNDSSLNMGVICPHGFERAGTTEKNLRN